MITYLKSMAYTLSIILIATIIITIFNYFNILNGIVLKVIELLIPLISIMIGSYMIGKQSDKKGYIEGIKYGLIWILIFVIANLFMKSMSISGGVYFLALIIFSSLAGILGINKKEK